MSTQKIVVFYKDGTHEMSDINNDSFDLEQKENVNNIKRIFVANNTGSAKAAIAVWGNK